MPFPEDPAVDAQSQVAHVAVKPPPFWKCNPTLWFVRLEAQFSLAGITSEITKFNHVVAALDADILTSVTDLLMNPPKASPYEALKKRLIDSHSESETSKIRTLLQGLELGDQRPSQLLARMQALAGTSVGEPLLKSLWLGRLPHNIQSILAALDQEVAELAKIADKIHEFTPHSIISAATSENVSEMSELRAQISQLSKQVSDLTYVVNKRTPNTYRPGYRSRQRSRSRDRFRRYKESQNGVCFYHTNFGDKAKKCSPPCSFRSSEN